MCKYMRRRGNQALDSGAQGQDERHRAQTEMQEVPSEHQEALGVTKPWHRLSRGGAVSSLEIFKSCQDVVLGKQLWGGPAGAEGCTRRPPEVPPSLSNSVRCHQCSAGPLSTVSAPMSVLSISALGGLFFASSS